MTTIGELRDRHAGETAWIVGRGPSLVNLTSSDIGRGPVIALNAAILRVRELGLPNPVYTQQKDGCYTGTTPIGEGRVPCGHCPSGLMTQPVEPETLLVSVDESPHCFADYPCRYVFDVVDDLGRPTRSNMSAPVATAIALLMGVKFIMMLGQDAYTVGDARVVAPDGHLVADEDNDRGFAAYVQGGEHSAAIASTAGVPIVWVTP